MVVIKKIYFKNLDIYINQGELVCVTGPIGSGKTTLLKMICNKLNKKFIYIDGKNINNYNIEYKKNNIICIFNDNIYNTRFPLDELKYYLYKLNINNIEIENRINNFIEYFKINKIIKYSFASLSNKDRVLIKILSLLIVQPKLVCIDDLLTYLDSDNIMRIFNYIKDNSITLISVISNIEGCLLYDEILLLDKGRTKVYDKVTNVSNYINEFNECGLSLPFIYDINNLLISYDLIKDKHIIEKDLVNVLWK